MKKSLFFLLILNLFSLFAQTKSVVRNIHIPLWAEYDAYPENYQAPKEGEGPYSYSTNRIKELGTFLITGMVYGWEFVYTPSDKARNVEEFFELKPISELSSSDIITYSDPFFEDNRINVWCDFVRNDYHIQNYNLWASIQNPVVHGKGKGPINKGFDGIIEAANMSVKEGVRQHFRAEIKNKPKEICGKILIKNQPVIGVVEGQYVIFLDFFLECDRIVKYKVY